MQKITLLLTLLFITVMFISCSKESEESMLLKAKNKLDEAKKLETDNKLEDAKRTYAESIDLYKAVLKEHPSSPKAAEIYRIIAELYDNALADYDNAIRFYKELVDKYPDTKEAKYAMFMMGYIYDDKVKNKEMAKEFYKKFLDKYPQDTDPNEKLSESVRFMLKMMDENKSIEDIIKSVPQDTTKKTEVDKNVKLRKIDEPDTTKK